MTVPNIKVKIQRRPTLKVKVLPRFPASVTVESPITLDRTGGNYAFSFDIDALIETLDVLYAPLAILDEPTVVTTSSYTVPAATVGVAIQRAAPSATSIALPTVVSRGGLPLRIVDWSSSVTDHIITITPHGSETIMLAATWPLYSNPASLGSLTLHPSVGLNGWYIAP